MVTFLFSSPSANRDCKDVVCFSAENFNFLAQKLQLDLHEPPVQQVRNILSYFKLNNGDDVVINMYKLFFLRFLRYIFPVDNPKTPEFQVAKFPRETTTEQPHSKFSMP